MPLKKKASTARKPGSVKARTANRTKKTTVKVAKKSVSKVSAGHHAPADQRGMIALPKRFRRQPRLFMGCIFAVLFAVFGAYMIFISHATTAILTIEAESMQTSGGAYVHKNNGASGKKTVMMPYGSSVSRQVMVTQAYGHVSFRARGSTCSGSYPTLSVSLDGATPALQTVNASSLTEFTLPIAGVAGAHTVKLSNTSSCSVKIELDWVSFLLPDATPTTTPTTTSPPPTTTQTGGVLGLVKGTIYYVDCNGGSDSNSGNSTSSAWKTLSKASLASVNPGDAIALMSGCTFSGQLLVTRSGNSTTPIYVTMYGSGSRPVINSDVNTSWDGAIKITGSYVVVDSIEAHGIITKFVPSGQTCAGTPGDYTIGFMFDKTSSHNTLQNSLATGYYAGAYILLGSSYNTITHSSFVNNQNESPNTAGGNDDAGAFAIMVEGNNNEISYNTMSGQYTCSADYSFDGSAVEIYAGSNNVVHHNTSVDNAVFAELGDSRTTNNTFVYNTIHSSKSGSQIIATRGSGDYFGPVTGTKVYNNTAYMTASNSEGIGCSGDCSNNVLSLYNNIIFTGYRAIYSQKKFDEGNNIYWRPDGSPLIQFPAGSTTSISSTSKIANPLFLSPANYDFHLQAGSPAIDAGAAKAESLAAGKDADGKVLATPLEIGAYQY